MEKTVCKRMRVDEVYGELRGIIADMAVGVPLPPVPELLRLFGASQTTMDRAYTLLEAEGRIVRHPGKGVFVADPLKGAGEIAIVLNRLLIGPGVSPVYGLACSRLGGDLQDLFPRWRTKMHLGAGDVTGPELPGTLDLLDPDVIPRLRGVLSFHALHNTEAELQAANVPVFYLGSGDDPSGNGVFLDSRPLYVQGIRHLAVAGCRSVCVLGVHHTFVSPRSSAKWAACMKEAAAAAGECGLRFRQEGLDIGPTGTWFERQGYELFMRVWRCEADRPDGILVTDDVLCGGVLRAILHLGLELPRDLRLITAANKGIGLPYHRPVSRMEYDVDAWVDKAARMLEASVRGMISEPAVERLSPVWIEGETT